MHGVASCAIDDLAVHCVFTVVNHDGPDVDEGEEANVSPLVQWEDEGEDVIRNTLGEAVYGMKGMTSKGGWDNPFVMRLVERLVDARVMQPAVDEVDAEVGKGNEKWELKVVVPPARALGGTIVHLGVAADFGKESWNCA